MRNRPFPKWKFFAKQAAIDVEVKTPVALGDFEIILRRCNGSNRYPF